MIFLIATVLIFRILKALGTALIIDDDLDLCVMLKSVLDSSVSEVQYAHTLETGKKLLKQLQPDIVFLDNNFPDGQGLDFIREIKSISQSSHLIFITAMDNSKGKALEYGADAFLEKPLTYRAIFQALNQDVTIKLAS